MTSRPREDACNNCLFNIMTAISGNTGAGASQPDCRLTKRAAELTLGLDSTAGFCSVTLIGAAPSALPALLLPEHMEPVLLPGETGSTSATTSKLVEHSMGSQPLLRVSRLEVVLLRCCKRLQSSKQTRASLYTRYILLCCCPKPSAAANCK